MGQDRVGVSALIVMRLVGGVLFVLGVIGYFRCATLSVRAQGTPAPIFPTASTVVSGPYHITRNPMYSAVRRWFLDRRCSINTGCWWVWRSLAVGFHSFVLFYEERALRARALTASMRSFAGGCRGWLPKLRSVTRRRPPPPVRIVPARSLSWPPHRPAVPSGWQRRHFGHRGKPPTSPSSPWQTEPLLQYAQRLARDSMRRRRFARHSDDVVLGADTVAGGGRASLEKPRDAADAACRLLSGRAHQVITGSASSTRFRANRRRSRSLLQRAVTE